MKISRMTGIGILRHRKNRTIFYLILVLFLITTGFSLGFQFKREVKEMGGLVITSKAFENEGMIPKKYTEKGENITPPIEINGVDPRAKTIAIIIDDPDIPIPFLTFTHWVVYNIPADVTEIPENRAAGQTISVLSGARQGKNSFGRNGYIGPNPPFGTHTYRFMVYTLDSVFELKPGASRRQLEKAMAGHVLQTGILKGRYGA